MTMQTYLNNNTYDVIIDVREVAEFESGHVEGAINMPLSTIECLNFNKNTKIAVYCRSGNRSEQAKLKLASLGYKDITNIGGVMDGSIHLIK